MFLSQNGTYLNSATPNLLLLRQGYPIAIIRMRDRDIYLDALATAASGDFAPLQDLIAEAMAESLRRAISFFS